MRSIKNKYLRFLTNVVFFMAIIFIMDLALGNVLGQLYLKQKSGGIYDLTYSLDSTSADVVILGASHARNHYIPSIIEDTLGLSCYNLGSGGQNIFYHYGIIGSLLERYTPRVVILDLITIDYRKTDQKYNTDRLSELLPFYHKYKAIREVVDLRGSLEKVRLLSNIYPFNSEIIQILSSFVWSANKSIILMDGYEPLYGNMSEKQLVVKGKENFELDPLKIKYIEKTIAVCKQNDIRLIIISSPSIANSEGESMSFDVISEIGKKYNIEVWNYENDSRFLKTEYLHDVYHLNDAGAHQFTMAIASRLKREKP